MEVINIANIDKTTFSDIRRGKQYTQQALADLLKVRQSTVCMWEVGKALPRVKHLKMLSEILDTDIPTLIAAIEGGNKDKNVTQKNNASSALGAGGSG